MFFSQAFFPMGVVALRASAGPSRFCRTGYMMIRPATRICEAELHPEIDVFLMEKVTFWTLFGKLKSGEQDPFIMDPIYV